MKQKGERSAPTQMAPASPGEAVQAKPESHGGISGRQHASPSPPQSVLGPGPGTARAVPASHGVAVAVDTHVKFKVGWVRGAPGAQSSPQKRQTELPLPFVPYSKRSSQAGSSAASQGM